MPLDVLDIVPEIAANRSHLAGLPGWIDLNGQRWAVSSNGFCVFARPGGEDLPHAGPDRGLIIAQFIDGKPTHRARLSQFVAALRSLLDACEDCKGTGRVMKPVVVDCNACDGNGYTECDHCESEITCEACHGKGELPDGKKQQEADCKCIGADGGVLIILGAPLGSGALYRALRKLPEQSIRIGLTGKDDVFCALFLEGEGWRYAQMQLTDIRGNRTATLEAEPITNAG